jgi:hypothetical protein
MPCEAFQPPSGGRRGPDRQMQQCPWGPGGRGAGGRWAGQSAAWAGAGRSWTTWASRCCSRPLRRPALAVRGGQPAAPAAVGDGMGTGCATGVGLEGRAAPQGPGLVRSAPARRAGIVSESRAAGRLLSAGGCAGRLPPGTLGGGGPPGRRDAACQRPATGGGAAPGGRAGGQARGRALLGMVVELGRALVCTNFGTEQVGAGWPGGVLELTARAFNPWRRGRRGGTAAAGCTPFPGHHAGGPRRVSWPAHLRLAARRCRRLRGWPRAAAGAVLGELVECGEAVGEAGSDRPRG